MSLRLCVVGCGHFARIFAQEMQAIAGEVDLSFPIMAPRRSAESAAEFNCNASFGASSASAAGPCRACVYLCLPHVLPPDPVARAT